jgi:uncharacterized tellurite resistance protein B-like protein
MKNDDIIDSVLSVLALDGSLNKWEIQFFNELCQRLGISQEVQQKAILRIKQGKGRIHLPEEDADKKRLLYFLIQAVVADGKISDKERHVLQTVVEKLGISLAYVEGILDQRLKEVKTERYTIRQEKTLVCPKCKYEQTSSYRCERCGVIFEKFKQAQEPTDEDILMDILSSTNRIKKKD